MVKVGLKGRHTLTGVSRTGVLTGATSRKAATKKLMGGKAAVGRMRQAATRRVPFTGVSKKAGAIGRRNARAPMSTAARAAAGMWVHDRFEEQDEQEEDGDDDEWAVDSSNRSTWSGDHGVQIVDHSAASRPTRAPKVVIHRGGCGREKSAPPAFKITLAGGRQHLTAGGAGASGRGGTPALTLASAPSTIPAASRSNVDGMWKHDLFEESRPGRGSGGDRGRARGSGSGRGGRAARRKSTKAGSGAQGGSLSLSDRLNMALGS